MMAEREFILRELRESEDEVKWQSMQRKKKGMKE